MAKQKANAKITAQTKINGELVSQSKEVYIPLDIQGCIDEYGETGCVDKIVNQQVLTIQADIRREIKVANGEVSEGSKARKGLERF